MLLGQAEKKSELDFSPKCHCIMLHIEPLETELRIGSFVPFYGNGIAR
jgi:hypothetical protein